ncbi:MAG: hypothetical protein J6X93_02640, partial [Bacilli bacterium]|nr:hypothetical protein [Bacilli bacterium]
FVEVFENDSQKVRIHLVDTATGAWKYDATLKLFTYALTGCAKETNNTTYYLGTYSNYTTMSASGTSYISGDKMSTIGVSQFPAYFGDLAEVEDTAKEYEITVATNSSDKAQVKELSAESGVKGSTFTFKVEAEENYVIDSVEVNGQVVEATNGVYTATVTGKMSIRVFTSEAAATEKTIEIDFTQLMQEIPQNKNARHSTTSVEVTVRGVTFDLRNVYQASASYLILAGKLTDADTEGNTSKTPAWIANRTPIPGKIISITVYGNAAGNPSGSAVYYLDAFENAKVEALETSATTITGLKETPLVYTAAEGSNLYYFNLSTTTAANGQITKIVITYEPGEAPQPAPTLTGVSVSGAANVDLVLNAETGLYEGTFSIERQWGRAYFKEVYSDGTNVALTYANATFAGNGILHEKAGGSPENNQLYADTDDMVAAGEFCYGISTKTNYVVSYNPQTKTLTVDVEEPGADATLVGVSVVGSANADLVLNEQTGLYEGTFTLGTQWNTVQFIEKYSDDTQNPLTYANATIQGSGIKNEKVDGAPWTSALFIDTDAAVQSGTFCYSLTSETKYLVRYNPETKLLLVDVYAPEVPATVKGVKFGGAKQGSFELKDGKYEAVVSLNQWNRISFTVVDENDKEIALWYTNATFTGAITAENKLGDAYDHTLYHESGDGLQWMPGAGSTRTYKFVYDPSTKTMSVERDTTAPVITVADAVMQALAAHDFVENEDASTLFGQLLAGISANDDMDGAIAVTQEMVDLGGLTLNKLVAGDYKLTITVKDVAGNEAKQEVPIHVRSMYANVDLLADSPNKHADYNSSNWTYDKYTSSWVDVTGTQMRCREKKDANQQSVWTINMACGYSTTYRYKYSTGKSLGIANKITVTWSNDYSSPQEIGVKIILVDAQGNQHYALGAAGNDGFVAIAAGTLLDAQEYTFDDVEVKTVMFVLYSKKSDGAFIYVNDVVLSYEEEQPVSSPAAFQLTNLNVAVPEFTSNHIEGAGVHMWVDPASIGLTMENWGTVTKEVSATVEGYTIGEHFLSDPSADAVRCFVTLDHAPAADEIVTLNVTITIDGQAYQAAVAFQNGALAQ